MNRETCVRVIKQMNDMRLHHYIGTEPYNKTFYNFFLSERYEKNELVRDTKNRFWETLPHRHKIVRTNPVTFESDNRISCEAFDLYEYIVANDTEALELMKRKMEFRRL